MKMNKAVPLITTDKLMTVRDYYVKHFGFVVTCEVPDGYLGLQAADQGAEIAFMPPCDECPPYQGGTTLCFEVEDVDAEHTRLVSAGLKMVKPLADNPWGDRSFITIDPAGVAVYVYGLIEPTDEFKKYFKD